MGGWVSHGGLGQKLGVVDALRYAAFPHALRALRAAFAPSRLDKN
jgi:hypothetical protein